MTTTEIQLAIPTALELARALSRRVTHRRWKEVSAEERDLFLEAGEAAVKVLSREGDENAAH